MRTIEIILVVAGAILFLFSLVIMAINVKRGKPYLRAIWLVLIAFFMMGFSSIVEAEIVGLFKFQKEKKLVEAETLAKTLEKCPDNEEIKVDLREKLKEIEAMEKLSEPEDKAVLGYAYFSLGDEAKAIENSKEALLSDKTNQTAQSVIDLIDTRQLIEKLSQSDNKQLLEKEIKKKLRAIKVNPTISASQKRKLSYYYYQQMNTAEAELTK